MQKLERYDDEICMKSWMNGMMKEVYKKNAPYLRQKKYKLVVKYSAFFDSLVFIKCSSSTNLFDYDAKFAPINNY